MYKIVKGSIFYDWPDLDNYFEVRFWEIPYTEGHRCSSKRGFRIALIIEKEQDYASQKRQ